MQLYPLSIPLSLHPFLSHSLSLSPSIPLSLSRYVSALPWLSWLKKMLFMRRRRWTLWKIKLFDCCSNYYSWLHLFALFLARNFIYNAGATCQTKRRPDSAACYLLLAASSLQLATYNRSSPCPALAFPSFTLSSTLSFDFCLFVLLQLRSLELLRLMLLQLQQPLQLLLDSPSFLPHQLLAA